MAEKAGYQKPSEAGKYTGTIEKLEQYRITTDTSRTALRYAVKTSKAMVSAVEPGFGSSDLAKVEEARRRLSPDNSRFNQIPINYLAIGDRLVQQAKKDITHRKITKAYKELFTALTNYKAAVYGAPSASAKRVDRLAKYLLNGDDEWKTYFLHQNGDEIRQILENVSKQEK